MVTGIIFGGFANKDVMWRFYWKKVDGVHIFFHW